VTKVIAKMVAAEKAAKRVDPPLTGRRLAGGTESSRGSVAPPPQGRRPRRRRDDGDGVGAGPDDLRGMSSVMPPMATRAPDLRAHAPDSPARRAGSPPAARGEHATDGNVVAPRPWPGALSLVVARDASIMPGRRRRRASRAGNSSCPTWTPSASMASARSTRSLMMKRQPALAARRQRACATDRARSRHGLVPQLDQPAPAAAPRRGRGVGKSRSRSLRVEDDVERRRQGPGRGAGGQEPLQVGVACALRRGRRVAGASGDRELWS